MPFLAHKKSVQLRLRKTAKWQWEIHRDCGDGEGSRAYGRRSSQAGLGVGWGVKGYQLCATI